MKANHLLLITFSLLVIYVTACTNSVTGPDLNGELPRELSKTEMELVENGQSFSFNVFKNTVLEDESENIFISPLSISIALGMTMNGARGKTYDQMRETLAFQGLGMEEINSGYQTLTELLMNADPKVKMEIANSVWSQQGFPVEEAFTDNLEEYFNAEARELDFNDPASADIINDWVSDNTNGLIKEIIEGQIPPEIIMYLINAIYFKGDWMYQFDEEDTQEAPFHLESGEQVMVDMMSQKRDFNMHFSEKVNMIDLPYGDSLFSMTVMVPADGETTLNEFIEQDLTRENFDSWTASLSEREMPLRFPKFELSYEIFLNDILISMGIKDAFDGSKADLTGINSKGGLFISEVKHKTFITVDEVGTEAAAITSVGVGVTSLPQTFSVDRPFVFVIREQNSGAILFMGKINNPDA